MRTFTETLYRREELEDHINSIIAEVIDNETRQEAIKHYDFLIRQINQSDVIRSKEKWVDLISITKENVKTLNFDD